MKKSTSARPDVPRIRNVITGELFRRSILCAAGYLNSNSFSGKYYSPLSGTAGNGYCRFTTNSTMNTAVRLSAKTIFNTARTLLLLGGLLLAGTPALLHAQPWTQVGSDIDGEAASDNSGYSVSLSSDGQTVAIGAVNNDGNGSSSGHVRVYKLVGGVWTQQGSDIDGEAVSDQSGYSVSLSSDGQTVAIGARLNGGNGSSSGHVRVYNRVPAAPEINLKGNGLSIADGDVTPDVADHTDFEDACVNGGTVVRTFTIENTGTADLTIPAAGITLSGANMADFTVGGISLPAVIAASGSTTFTVTFDPSAAGLRSASLSITNDDADENPYNFDIQGTGNAAVTPAVSITASPALAITPGTSVTFTATPTNGGATPAYQWKKNNVNVGTDSPMYTDATLANGDVITVILTSSDPCADPATATSNPITMEVYACLPDGITWTSRSAAQANNWQSVTYGNGLFVAVAGSGTNRVMTSPDGIAWTARSAAQANQWQSVTYGNGLFVAVAQSGSNRVMTSPDGITWTAGNAAEANSWRSVTYGNGLFVAVAQSGTNRVMTSPDGITWTARSASEPNNWISVTYGNGLFAAVSSDGSNRVMTSPDGIAWTARSAAEANFWFSVTYGNGLFVAVAQSGANRVMTSPDGITWTARSAAQANSWTSVAYGAGLFVAVANSGFNRVMTSPDGITWTARNAAASSLWRSVTFGNGLFVAVAELGTNRVMTNPDAVTPAVSIAANPGNSIFVGTSVTFTATPTNGGATPAYQWKKNNVNVGADSPIYTDATLADGDVVTVVMTSSDPCPYPAMATSNPITMEVNCLPDGISWTARNAAEASLWRSVTYGNGLFVAVAENGTNRVMTSPDGISWTARSAAEANQWTSVTYGNGLFVAVSQNGANRVMTSPDGITWTARSAAEANSWQSVTYGNGLFVAVAGSGTNRVMTSPDGITWTARSAAQANLWRSVTYGNGLFVAVAASGTNRVMTSPDGITWTARSAAEANNWFSVTNGNGLFVAVAASGTNRVMTSPDGISWTARSAAQANAWFSVTYGNGLFVAVAANGTNRVMTSPDGIIWTARSAAQANQWFSVAYGNGLFVAVATGGTNRVMTNPGVTPTVSIAANPGNNITVGTSVTFTATPTNGGAMPAYQWKKNNVNVGTDSPTYIDAALADGDVITVVMTSNDPCADPATATSNQITMVVCTPPTFTTCPVAPVTANTVSGQCDAVVTYNVAADGTPTPALTYAFTGATTGSGSGTGSGATFNAGNTTVTVTATNTCGAPTCVFTVTVTDNEPPTISCPANTTVAADGSCSAQIGSYVLASKMDNCTASGSITESQSPVSTTSISGHNSVQTVTLTATDAASNTATCSFSVTLKDVTAPTIVCPANTTVSADIFGNYTVADFTGSATASDNCTANPSKTQSPAIGSTLGVGNHTITLTATDGAGLTGTCTFTLTAQAGCTAPAVSCPANLTVTVNANCTADLADYTGMSTVSGGCGNSTVTQSPAIGATLGLGNHTVTLTATDQVNNTGTCAFTVTLADNTPPTITCAGPVSINTTPGLCTGMTNLTCPTLSDNCLSPVAGNALNFDGTNDYLATASTLTLFGSTPTTIELWAKQNVSSNFKATVGIGNNNFYLNFHGGIFTPWREGGYFYNSGGTITPGVWTHWAVTYDGAGTFRAYKNGSPTPTATFSKTQAAITGAVYVGARGTSGFFNGEVDEVRIWTVERTQAEIAANMSAALTGCEPGLVQYFQFNQGVAGGDNTGLTTVTATTGLDGTLSNFALNGATSNWVSGVSLVGLALTNNAPSTYPIGNTTVTWTATDAAGNTETCQQTVTVTDNELPTITCPANIHANNDAGLCSAVVHYAVPVGLDNCQGQTTMQTAGLASGAVFAVGATTNTFVVTAANSQTASCSFTVTVTDNEAPSVGCPTNQTVPPTISSPCATIVNGIDGTFNDNCPGSTLAYNLSGANTGSGSGQASGLSFNAGVTTVEYTATDAGGGLTSTCSFTVTVQSCLEFSGTILWSNDLGTPVQQATVNLSGSGSAVDQTDVNGGYFLPVLLQSGNFTVKPVKNINRLNGVTVADAVAIQQHLTNSNPITNPYKMIAADINRSNSISTIDATLINQCLLGNPVANNIFSVFWRFAPKSWTPVLPPWGFPEKIDLTGVNANQSGLDFYGVKIGDIVNGDANPANFGGGPGPLVLRANDALLEGGKSYSILFTADAFVDLTAWQFALGFDPNRLHFDKVEAISDNSLLPIGPDQFGLWNLDAGEIRSVWSQANGIDIPGGTLVFKLHFTALESGVLLSDALKLDDSILSGGAFNSSLEQAPVALYFSTHTSTGSLAGAPYLLLQNRPNPFSAETTIGFVLPAACDAQLRIFDATGRLLWEVEKDFPAGGSSETLQLDGLTASGVLYYELTTPYGTLRKRMVRVGN
ncbi:MAG: HYR domain-containing protein [Saprospiraceae bacterium]